MAQLEPQPHLTNHHLYHDQGEPSSSSSPPEIMPSSMSSSSPSSSAASTQHYSSPPKPINASHYSILLHDNVTGLRSAEIGQGTKFSDLVSEPDNNTPLHLAAGLGALSIINLLKLESRFLLTARNAKGELPVHVAARACQLQAVKQLLSDARDVSMLVDAENEEKNTALHIALQNRQQEMAKYLFGKCNNTFYHLNNQGFSPLYLAIKAEYWDLAKDMLSNSSMEDDPLAEGQLKEGKSVVHAAIIAKKTDILKLILKAYPDELIYSTDELGRTPPSYAAYTGFLEGVIYMISSFRNQFFKKDDKAGYYPIHWACRGGNVKVVKALFSLLPKSTGYLLNSQGQNILHVAAGFGRAEVVKYILQQSEFETLINMGDEDGNTPFHLASKGKHPKVVYDLTWDERVALDVQNRDGCTALDIAEDYYADVPSIEERLTWLSLRYAGVPRAPQLHYTNTNINDIDDAIGRNNSINPTTFIVAALDQQRNHVETATATHPKAKRRNKYKERINTLLVVSILVTTVTYASGFTVPGGYNNNPPQEGMATLAHKCAFQVFVVTNTIAMYTSILAAVALIWAHLDDLRLVLLSLDFALPLLGTALAMMSVAFMAGLYVVLHGVVFWLSIMVLVMEGAFLGAFLVLFIPLYSPTSCLRNNTVLRCVFHVPFSLLLLACKKDKHGIART